MMMANKPKGTNSQKEEDELPFKSFYKWCHAWTHGAMRSMTKKWIMLKPRTNLYLDPPPLANIIAQTHNMIRVYGTHTESEIKNWDLSYNELGKMFDKRLVKPKWYEKKIPRYRILALGILNLRTSRKEGVKPNVCMQNHKWCVEEV